jgi:hypothetical protein
MGRGRACGCEKESQRGTTSGGVRTRHEGIDEGEEGGSWEEELGWEEELVRKPLPHSSTPRKGLTSDEGCLSQFARREDRGAEKKGRSAAR